METLPDGDARELAALRAEHRALCETLAQLDGRLAVLERRPPPAGVPLAPAPSRVSATPPPLPRQVREVKAAAAETPELPPPLPAFVPPPAPGPVPPEFPPAAAAHGPVGPSLEERIGGTWLVRVGIVALLMSLALTGFYLYEHVVPQLGPAGKIALLGLAAGAVTGLGAWLERRSAGNPGLLNYARVIFGGGLAAVYYVTYAAHFNPGLRVIANPWLAGALQLGWAGCMVWLADRRKSETLATFAVLLAYFTSATNGVAAFTLFSNLALTAAAVFLLLRHRWAVFSFASLSATYGSYLFWRWASLGFEPAVVNAHAFWTETTFLGLYWLLFTAAAFLVSEGTLPPGRKAAFVSLNHGALFALVSMWVQSVYRGQFWLWAVGFGAVLIALGALPPLAARGARVWTLDRATAGATRLLGIVFLTLGVLSYFSGWQLALALAAESVVLTVAAGQASQTWERRLLLGPAFAVALLAGGAAGLDLVFWQRPTPQALWTGGGVGAALVFAAFWCGRGERRGTPPAPVPAAGWLRFGAGWFALVGTAVWLAGMVTGIIDPNWCVAAVALGAAGLTLAAPVLRLHLLAWIGLLYFGCALEMRWEPVFTLGSTLSSPAFPTMIVSAVGIALCHWWQRQRTFPWPGPWKAAAQVFLAFGALATLDVWLQPRFSPAGWMVMGSALALGVCACGLLTRSWALALAAQVPFWTALGVFLERILTVRPLGAERWPALVPVGAAVALVAAARWFEKTPAAQETRVAEPTRWARRFYESLAVFLFAAWTMRFAPAEGRFALLALGGAGLFTLGWRLEERRWTVQGGVLMAFGWLVYALSSVEAAPARLSPWNLVGFLALAALAEALHRTRPAMVSSWIPPTLACAAALGGWRWLTDTLTARVGGGWTLAAGWSLYAAGLLAAGLGWRERVYRWLGLGILGCTLGRIALVDFWNADTPHRILDLLAFSVVLLGLGFVYNRYGAKLRQWM